MQPIAQSIMSFIVRLQGHVSKNFPYPFNNGSLNIQYDEVVLHVRNYVEIQVLKIQRLLDQ